MQVSSEIVIDAPQQAILDALADIDNWPTWSSVHKRCHVIDAYPDGRPHHVGATIRVLGFTDKEVLEYHWGPSWVVFDVEPTLQQRGQHGEWNLIPELGKTRVRFDGFIELVAPVPEFMIKRGRKILLDVATKGLQKRVMREKTS